MKGASVMQALTTMSVAEVMTRLGETLRQEWAFIDVREVGEAAEGHPFGATNLPYSKFELAVAECVPRRATHLVLIDGGDGVANRAASRIRPLGYGNLSVVAGGIPAWLGAGLPLLKGVHTWSKAFGEWVQHHFDTPDISAEALAQRLSEANPPLVIDVRPLAEHRRFTIPAAVNCPTAELSFRLPDMVASDRPIVVHCAGRTRSIIGVQTLRDLGVSNPVVALRDGTQGWELAGFTREIGADRAAGTVLSSVRHMEAAERAGQMMAREGMPLVDGSTFAQWLHDNTRTTYLFDPRNADEGSPAPGFRRSPGTTLIQQTDQFIAVRGARVVLFDPVLSRAAFAALWLRRMGIEAHVLNPNALNSAVAPFGVMHDAPVLPPALPALSASDLAAHVGAGGPIVDLRPFAAYAAVHVAGAIRCPRPRLDRLPFAAGTKVAIVADDPVLAALSALDLAEVGLEVVGISVSNPTAWAEVGLGVSQAYPATAAEADHDHIDEVRFCAGRHDGNLDDARAYLAWETGLLAQLSASGLMPWPITEHKDAQAGD